MAKLAGSRRCRVAASIIILFLQSVGRCRAHESNQLPRRTTTVKENIVTTRPVERQTTNNNGNGNDNYTSTLEQVCHNNRSLEDTGPYDDHVPASSTNAQQEQVHTHQESSCGIYFAPSTIPGAGMGMFAGRSYRLWDTMSPGDIILPLVDWSVHTNHQDIATLDAEAVLMNVYYWTSSHVSGMPEDAVDSYAYSPGIGAAINCHFGLINVQGDERNDGLDNAGWHRSRDPGVGAFTPYHGRTSYAVRNIAAGEELFADYGSKYFTYNQEKYGNIPIHESYTQADELLRAYVVLRDRVFDVWSDGGDDDDDENHNSDDMKAELHRDWYGLLTDLAKVWPSRTLNALPEDPTVVHEIAIMGTAWTHYNRSVRSLEWLEETGYCMDLLVPGDSSIPQAGRGAFARVALPQGSVVGPAPLIHLNPVVLDMFPFVYDGPKGEYIWANTTDRVWHRQILMNYCFGHAQMPDVVLCPYGMLTSLINHAPTKDQVNAKIVWNTPLTNQKWIDQDPSEWMSEMHVGLYFNFVATKDIAPGEEILIDYGADWEAAWNHHVQTWKPPPGAEWYRSASELNEDHDLILPTTGLEGSLFSFSVQNVELSVFEIYRAWNGRSAYTEKYHLCRIVARTKQPNTDEWRYVAETFVRGNFIDDDSCYEEFYEVLWDLPRDAFVFTDVPYSRDFHQPWSFRHLIGIPDDIVPTAWKK